MRYVSNLRTIEIGSIRNSAKETLKKLVSKTYGKHKFSSESAFNILLALYGFWINLSGKRLVLLSKGHAATALYAVYAGLGVLKNKDIEDFCKPESKLQSHPEPPLAIIPTGSLGNGISVANGIALASRIKGFTTRVAVIVGDGEINEGSVWEAVATASHYKLWEVIVLIDANGRQLSGPSSNIKNMEPLADKWEAFGWRVFEVNNKLEEIISALKKCEIWRQSPSAIIVRWK